jgi:hypothetical protein
MARVRPAETPKTKYGERILQLKPECKGLDVWELQIKLIGWGSGSDNDGIGNRLDPVRVTGTFDTTTRDAVMRFQKAHKLDVNGVVGDATFRAIDKEAALHPILVHDLRCPCAKRTDNPEIVCRCEKHDEKGKCTGFGKGKFAGKSLITGKKLADDTSLDSETLDLYDMKEHDGMDKAVLWAVRALMHRAEIKRLVVVAGYRCWHDNYLHTDDRRWRHRRQTFHLGKTIEFYHAETCTHPGNAIEYREADKGEWTEIGFDWKDNAVCARCATIRGIAQSKCGFQLRWQEPDRVSVAEGTKEAKVPTTPFSVHVNTVRRLGREDDDFIKTHVDAVKPLYPGKLSVSLPIDLGSGLDPKVASSETYFRNTEASAGGWYPLGASRTWHGGVHLYGNAGAEVHSIAPGEIVACRLADPEERAYGSRNFVLVRHEWKTKKWYSLYMHLDEGKAEAASTVRWRKQLYAMTKDNVEIMAPTPFFLKKEIDDYKADKTTMKKNRLLPLEGLPAGDRVAVTGAEAAANTLDDQAPPNSSVLAIDGVADTYVYTKLENKEAGKLRPKDDSLAAKLAGKVIGLKVPIPVGAGELLGTIAKAPTDDVLKAGGAFLHLEVFSAEQLLTGEGIETISVTDPAKAADRQAIVIELTGKKLLAPPTDKVLLQEDLEMKGEDPQTWPLRSVILKMPNAWSFDWKPALSTPECLTFLKDVDRDKRADDFNEYRWWADAKPGGFLPDSETVFHYHPIAFLLAIAFEPPPV